MASFTLDEIREATEAQFGSLDITLDDGRVAKLLNPMRLTSQKRGKLMDLQDALGALEDKAEAEGGPTSSEVLAEQERMVDEILLLVSENQTIGKALLSSFGGDMGIKMTVFSKYTEGTQAGEASASHD